MFVDVAVADKRALESMSSRLASHRQSPGVVVKSLAEIKAEKVCRMQQQQQRSVTAEDTRMKTSEPALRNKPDFKIKLCTQRGAQEGTAFLQDLTYLISWCWLYALVTDQIYWPYSFRSLFGSVCLAAWNYSVNKQSPANAILNAQQRCTFESPVKQVNRQRALDNWRLNYL